MSHLMYECVSVPFARRENSPKIHYLLIFPLSLTANKCQTQNILYKNEIRAIGLHNVGGGRPGGEWCFEKERNHTCATFRLAAFVGGCISPRRFECKSVNKINA